MGGPGVPAGMPARRPPTAPPPSHHAQYPTPLNISPCLEIPLQVSYPCHYYWCIHAAVDEAHRGASGVPHRVRPVGQVPPHTLSVHVVVPPMKKVHLLPHAPQFQMSLLRLLQWRSPGTPHSARPGGHVVLHCPSVHVVVLPGNMRHLLLHDPQL